MSGRLPDARQAALAAIATLNLPSTQARIGAGRAAAMGRAIWATIPAPVQAQAGERPIKGVAPPSPGDL